MYVSANVIPRDQQGFAREGFHYGMAFMKGENYKPPLHHDTLDNRGEIPSAAVLLSWLQIGDQEGHNQYLHRVTHEPDGSPAAPKNYFRLVDMGQMFGDFNWTAAGIAGEAVHLQVAGSHNRRDLQERPPPGSKGASTNT